MKKFVLSTFVLGFLMMGAVATHAAKWAGVKGGVNLGDLAGDAALRSHWPDVFLSTADTHMRRGFTGGAFFGLGISERFGIQIEGLYVMKGAYEGGPYEGSGDNGIRLDYLEFPLLFVADLPAGEFAFKLFAGPTFSFVTSAEKEAGGVTDDIKDETKSFDLGAAVGGGIEYAFASFSIVGDVRYTIGASNAFEDVDGQAVDVKNRGIGIMAGLSFPIGGN